MSSGFRLVNRDYLILKEVYRWRVILGRHICALTGFSGQRACDRRLHKLIGAGILQRNKVLFGIPSVSRLTPTAKALLEVPNKQEHLRIEQITHDISVVDTAIYFNRRYNIPYSDMITEKQLHQQDGFGKRAHRPDFVFTKNNNLCCVEVELSLKSKDRFRKNIIDNFNNYHKQIWIVPDLHTKIFRLLSEMSIIYPNIDILDITEVKKNGF